MPLASVNILKNEHIPTDSYDTIDTSQRLFTSHCRFPVNKIHCSFSSNKKHVSTQLRGTFATTVKWSKGNGSQQCRWKWSLAAAEHCGSKCKGVPPEVRSMEAYASWLGITPNLLSRRTFQCIKDAYQITLFCSSKEPRTSQIGSIVFILVE